MTKPWTAKELAKAEKAIEAIENGSAEFTAYKTPSGVEYAIFDNITKPE